MNTVDTASQLRNLNRIRRISRLMDTAFKIPVLGLKVGWDPVLGLIPGLGDLIATAVSAYVIVLAARFGLPRGILAQMVLNIGLEAVVGTVPLVGDLFDAFYKSNVRNLKLLEAHLQCESTELEEADSLNLNSVQDGEVYT
ncbi:DUF4112 domain-containing protein [Phormidium tenue]|uniref:DUF4112 domain-containing protein n=1 Tax=Phormidium tenue NIES-30 TaxID=549789 RepID=A0A1U7J455_9CYAN|nr:DUF4112 domain-containing protein [Phormidium tenue]MBD2232981.1 DUF4112 domain-containing protein [Phormidium tenue FACHB-1052]OKH47193.1 hypothetical protein NIES30_14605 [Phormidium tenue NIES-30]